MKKREKPSATRSRDPERSRNSLIDAATFLFASRGYDGCSIQEISERAGVNKAMISYHFGGKKGLYSAVVRNLIGGVRDRLLEIQQSTEPARDRLCLFIRALMEFAVERKAFGPIVLREHLAGGANFDESILPEFFQFFETTRSIVLQGIRAGEFRTVDPHAVHLSLVGSLVFFLTSRQMRQRLVSQRKIDAGDPALDEFLSHTEELFLGGLEIRPAKTRSKTSRKRKEKV